MELKFVLRKPSKYTWEEGHKTYITISGSEKDVFKIKDKICELEEYEVL